MDKTYFPIDSKNILLIEDNVLTADLISTHLTKKGFSVHALHRGEFIQEFLKTNQVDMILLDNNLPDMSGLDILSNLRESYSVIELPIIMVTAEENPEIVVKALLKGANDYLPKPLNFEIAAARIETQLSLKTLHKKSLKNKQLETLNAMIVTYNHEINSPLTILNLILNRDKFESKDIETARRNITRITDILKQIQNLIDQGPELVQYTEGTAMFKLKDQK